MKDQIIHVLGFVGYVVSVAMAQLGCGNWKAATDHMKLMGWQCANKTLYTKAGGGRGLAQGL